MPSTTEAVGSQEDHMREENMTLDLLYYRRTQIATYFLFGSNLVRHSAGLPILPRQDRAME